MILWTIQSMEAWHLLQKTGLLRCDTRYIDTDYSQAYEWMARQMVDRLDVAPVGTNFPLWAWYQWKGEHKRKPDLRSRGHLSRGKSGVRVEFEIDETHILLSDFDLWHYVLNYCYLPASLADEERFEVEFASQVMSYYENRPLPESLYDQKIKESWVRIFDLDWSDPDIIWPKAKKQIQATFWELTLDNVREVDEFVAR